MRVRCSHYCHIVKHVTSARRRRRFRFDGSQKNTTQQRCTLAHNIIHNDIHSVRIIHIKKKKYRCAYTRISANLTDITVFAFIMRTDHRRRKFEQKYPAVQDENNWITCHYSVFFSYVHNIAHKIYYVIAYRKMNFIKIKINR
jgi:hypothetical protein